MRNRARRQSGARRREPNDCSASSRLSVNRRVHKAQTGGPTAKVFNLNFGALLEQAAQTFPKPRNIWVGDEGARAAVEQLTRDVGMHGGPLELASVQEAFAVMLMGIVGDRDEGLPYHRFAFPQTF
jgi:8-hydroxy-5-deazaflavin:NADPH oxidoreductase